MTAKTQLWTRIGRAGKYQSGKDSPENHYINPTVVAKLDAALRIMRPVDEQYVAKLKNLFVAGLNWANVNDLKRGVPTKLATKLISARVAISLEYERAWKRVPYKEEYRAIFDQANSVR